VRRGGTFAQFIEIGNEKRKGYLFPLTNLRYIPMRSRADATHSIKQIEISAPLKKTKDEELASFL